MKYELKENAKKIEINTFQKAIENLKKYNQGLGLLNDDFSKHCYGQKFLMPMDKMRIQNSDLNECIFMSSISRTNMSGSHFNKCNINQSIINNSNMQFSDFVNCNLLNCEITGSNFSNCFFQSTALEDNQFVGSNFLRSQFSECIIEGGELLSSSFEFAEFTNSYISNMRLANLSMEYSEFNNIHMDNVILPFAQLPFIFKGLDYIMTTTDKVYISSKTEKDDRISIDEYINTFEDWKIFFYGRELYFPLANILLAQGEKKEALEAILTGIYFMINHSDYRMLKYLCKLVAMNPIVSISECHMLYKRISEILELKDKNDEQRYQYMLHMDDIKNILINNPRNEAKLSLTFRSNIEPQNREYVFHFISFIEDIVCHKLFHTTPLSISMSHNSPYEIMVLLIGSLVVLSKVTNLIRKIVENIKVSTEDIMEIQNIIKYGKENAQLDNEHKKALLLEQQLECEKTKLEILKFQKELENNNIQMHITHNIQENNKIFIA